MDITDRGRETAVAWIRVSSSTQDVERQRRAISDWATERKITIDHWYSVVESRHAEHSAYAQILERATKSHVDFLICSEIDRLGLRGTFDFVADLRALGVRIASVAEGEEQGGFVLGGIKLVLSQAEIERLSLRTSAGSRLGASKGYWQGGPCPYGYESAYVSVDGKLRRTLQIVEEEAQAVRKAFEMCLSGYSMIDIASNLGWVRQTVWQRLTNPVYTGASVYNRKSCRIGRRLPGHQKVIWQPRGQWIIADGAHPAIVNGDIFVAAQKALRSRRYYPGGRDPQLLQGRAFCSKCNGRRMRVTRLWARHKVRKYIYYSCPDCRAYHRVDHVEAALLGYLRERLMREDTLRSMIPSAEQGQSVASIKRDIAGLQKRIGNVVRAIEKGEGAQSPRLTERLNELEQRERELRAQLIHQPQTAMSITHVRQTILILLEKWSPEIVKRHIERVEIAANGDLRVQLAFRSI
jgi:DNA invertase Pin-like site-specific DNA recombinase